MPLDHAQLQQRLLRHLQLNGPAKADVLQAILGISQASFSRLLPPIGEDLLVDGQARARLYAARRSIDGLPTRIPVYTLHGAQPKQLLVLHPIGPRGFFVETETPLKGFYPDLPWFLHDLRPAGFLGRLVPHQHPALRFPMDIRQWSSDQVLSWLYLHGSTLMGSLVVGEPALQQALSRCALSPLSSVERMEQYPILAETVMAIGVPGSSAGGEQPKFLATRDGVPVLVKFSPPIHDALSRRIADLFACEHIALQVIAQSGIPAAKTEFLLSTRAFLEVERFDCQGPQRRGMVSLMALDMEFVGSLQNWSTTAHALLEQGILTYRTYNRICWLQCFGELIGNTDMHAGNLSFFFEEGQIGELSPVYDMLPMRYAPRGGELSPFSAPPTVPSLRPDLWASTQAAAKTFWERVSTSPLISEGFRSFAACL